MGEYVRLEVADGVGTIRLDRPKMNALNVQMQEEIREAALEAAGRDDVGAVVIYGGERVFAAGADIKEMAEKDFSEAFTTDFISPWQRISRHKKPIIAAVAGFALGGGCELAMMCDIILAAENARFGQPEINLGTIPGAGGTQRLIRAIGKSKAMEMILTGRMMDAKEAESSGLVTRVVPVADLVAEAIKIGDAIGAKSQPIVAMAKEAVNAAYENSLGEGLKYERNLFYASFATEDRREGMAAFAEKRPPAFTHR